MKISTQFAQTLNFFSALVIADADHQHGRKNFFDPHHPEISCFSQFPELSHDKELQEHLIWLVVT